MKNLKEILKLIPVLYDKRKCETDKIYVSHKTSMWYDYIFKKYEFLSIKDTTSKSSSRAIIREEYCKISIKVGSNKIVIDDIDVSVLEPEEMFTMSLENPFLLITEEIQYLTDNFIDCEIIIDKQFSTELYDRILEFCDMKNK